MDVVRRQRAAKVKGMSFCELRVVLQADSRRLAQAPAASMAGGPGEEGR